MIVKPSKQCKDYYKFLAAMLIIWIAIGIYENEIVFYMIIVVIVGLWICLSGITSLKTFIFDENGCTVQLYKYQRTYEWSQIAIKKYEKVYFEWYYSDGVFFSLKPVKKPEKLSPLIYGVLKPFSTFFVVFTKKELVGKTERYPIVHEVDRNNFLMQLAAWGVEIEDNPYQQS